MELAKHVVYLELHFNEKDMHRPMPLFNPMISDLELDCADLLSWAAGEYPELEVWKFVAYTDGVHDQAMTDAANEVLSDLMDE